MSEEKAQAGLISLESLTGEIGESKEEKQKKELKDSEKELSETLAGKKPDHSFGNFVNNNNEEEEEEEKDNKDPLEEEDDEGSDKDGTEKEEGDKKSSESGDDKESSETSDSYRSVIEDMFGESAGTIVQEDEDGNEVETPLSELDIDEELFKQIVQSKIEEEREKASEGKISTKGLSDFAKSLVEIDRSGGDISSLLEMKKVYSDPLDNLDMSTPEGKKQAIYLRKKAANPDEDYQEIQLLIEMYEKKGLLDDKAEAAESELRGALDAEVERQKETANKAKEDREELLKNYRKDIKTSITSQFELNDKTVKRLVDMSTKADENGRFELDNIYSEFRRDPQRAAKLALLMLDEEEFIKQVSSKEVKNEKKKSGRIKLRAKTGSSSTEGSQKKDKKGDGLVDMSIFDQ